MSRNYTVGAADATTGVAAVPTAPNAGVAVKIPAETEHLDVPKALIDFVNSMPKFGGNLSSAAPNAAGTAASGTSQLGARADHVHPAEIPAHSAATNGKVLAVDTTGALAWVTPAAPVTELKPPVASAAALPAAGNTDGDIRITLDDGHMHIWNDNPAGWVNIGPAAASASMTATVVGKASGTAAIGSDPQGAHADHVHPSDLPIVAAAAPAVTGLRQGTMWWDSGTGDMFILFGTPGKWVQVGGGGGPQHTISQADPTPADGADGDIWFTVKP